MRAFYIPPQHYQNVISGEYTPFDWAEWRPLNDAHTTDIAELVAVNRHIDAILPDWLAKSFTWVGPEHLIQGRPDQDAIYIEIAKMDEKYFKKKYEENILLLTTCDVAGEDLILFTHVNPTQPITQEPGDIGLCKRLLEQLSVLQPLHITAQTKLFDQYLKLIQQ